MIPVPRHRQLSPGVAKAAGWICAEGVEQYRVMSAFSTGAAMSGNSRAGQSGLRGGGATPDAAIQAPRDVLAHKRDGGHPVPPPSTPADIVASGQISPGENAVLVPLLIDSGRTVRANVSFDAALLEAIDSAAKERGVTRSAFLAGAARRQIFASA
jgi:hypothetical protein